MNISEENGQTVVKVIYDSIRSFPVATKESGLRRPTLTSIKIVDQLQPSKLEVVESPVLLKYNGKESCGPFSAKMLTLKTKSAKPSKRTIPITEQNQIKKTKIKHKTSFEIQCEQFLTSANKSHMLKKD